MSTQATGIEALVCQDIARRQQAGIVKYGSTVQDMERLPPPPPVYNDNGWSLISHP